MSELSAIKKLQQRIDELIVQTELGKAEAVDHVEESKQRMLGLIDRVSQSTEAKTKPLKARLGELRLQLELGKMESKDAYLEQREKIEHAITQTGESLEEAGHTAKEEFHDLAHSLSDKTHMLALNLGAAGILAKEKAAKTKTNVKTKLTNAATELKDDKRIAKETAHRIADESRGALEDVLSNLRTLFD